MRWLTGLLVALAVATVHAPALAQQTMVFSDDSYTQLARIRGDGPITAQTPADFDAFVAAFKNGPIEGVYLNSSGGSLGAALEFGRRIRRRGFNTIVKTDDRCVSACAYAFFGGRERFVFPTYVDHKIIEKQEALGFHQFSYGVQATENVPARRADALADRVSSDVQSVSGLLATYVADMGVNPEIIGLSTGFTGSNLLFPDRTRLEQLNIITDREADTADFVLLPYGERLAAVWRHLDDQVTVACVSRPGHVNAPAMIFTMPISGDPALSRPDAPLVRLDKILPLSALPWTARDLEHKHFHAHAWITTRYWNPVFSTADFSYVPLGGEYEYLPEVPVTASTVEFLTDRTYFHALLFLPPDAVSKLKVSKEFGAFLEEDSNPRWQVSLKNKPIDREILGAALQSCS